MILLFVNKVQFYSKFYSLETHIRHRYLSNSINFICRVTNNNCDILFSLHVSGEQLEQLTGLCAILRYGPRLT